MTPQGLTAAFLAVSAALLCLLGIRAWGTLRAGREFQDRLSALSADDLHRFLCSPRGAEPAQPADILYRLNALMEFERRGDPRWLPLCISLLEDPHPSVVGVCQEALRERTGENFRDAENDTLPDPKAWREWWEANRSGYGA